jgi:4-diphosphocytidyl-2-C-methyl-D-erythritol kinase
MTRLFLGLPAPAKLNLFLHVIGRRDDGYHELQSVFVPIDLTDTLDFELRDDGAIERGGELIGDPARDLCVRAAQLLQSESGTQLGVSIGVEKHIPAGSGMGGGSSDAATTLIALNRLWRLHWPRARLAALALRLGADVPFFLQTGPAFVEGIGERVTPIDFPRAWFAVVHPQVAVATAEIFADPGLTRNSKATIISAFSAARERFPSALFGANDLEQIVRRRFPEIDAALALLSRFGPARMTGSGSAVFVPVATADLARAAVAQVPAGWSGWAVQSLEQHPLAEW